jgi:hypothetical protein
LLTLGLNSQPTHLGHGFAHREIGKGEISAATHVGTLAVIGL